MARSCKLICAFALAVGLVTASAGAALASTLYVNGKTGNDTNPCTEPAAPCKTIDAAVIKSEAIEGTATIEVAAGLYEEDVKLEKPADDGIAIGGAGSGGGGTEIVGVKGSASVKVGLPGGSATVSNLSVVTPSGDEGAGIDAGGTVTLDDVIVHMRDASSASGIEAGELGSVTMNGGGVFMESGTKGEAITSRFIPLTLNGAEIAVASGATGGGVEDEGGSLSISSSSVSLAASSEASAIVGGIAPVSISNVSIVQAGKGSNAHAIELPFALPGSVSGVKVKMENAASSAGAIVQALGTDSYGHVEVGGAWIGPAFQAEGGNATFSDSRLIAGPTDATPAVAYFGFDETPGLLLQRTVVQAPATAAPGALEVLDGNATLDSSEVLGGASGVIFVQEAGKERRLTVAASTIDAGKPGVADGAGVFGVAVGAGGTASHANVLIEGSILLEGQFAEVGAGEKDEATVTCKDSDAPSQTQAASGAAGAINCAAGSEGNTHSTPESLFAAPITNYQLNPSSSAVDSVPTGEIKLPFGLTPSTTDLAGNPRSEDLDCVALQDKGALELQGRSTPCPVAVPSSPRLAETGRGRDHRAADQPQHVPRGPLRRHRVCSDGGQEQEIRREGQLPRQPGRDHHVHRAARILRTQAGQVVQEALEQEQARQALHAADDGRELHARRQGGRKQPALQRSHQGQEAPSRHLRAAGRRARRRRQRANRHEGLHDQVTFGSHSLGWSTARRAGHTPGSPTAGPISDVHNLRLKPCATWKNPSQRPVGLASRRA